jgi:hypothetical protein
MDYYRAPGLTDRPRRAVVDHITDNGSANRLDPDHTFHDAGIREGDELRIGFEATAGVSPRLWQEAVLRVWAQIRRYANEHPGFRVVDTDDDQLPTWYLLEFEAPGFAPPSDSRADSLEPKSISQHKVEIGLPADFPVRAPIVIWRTPIFHPNVLPAPQGPMPAGLVCLGPVMDDYRPNLDFGELCNLLVDLPGYRAYKTMIGDDREFFNAAALQWARTENGQTAIRDIGGQPLPSDKPPTRPRPLELGPVSGREGQHGE